MIEILQENKDYCDGYFRKSLESEDRQVGSIPAQISECSKTAQEYNLKIKELFKESKSAKAPGRPEFNRLVAKIEEGKTKIVVCWKLNRLFRNPKDEGTIRWLLQSGKLKAIVTPHKIYFEADSDFQMAIEGAQAQRFISDLRKDTKRGVDAKLEKGIYPGQAPTGYVNNTYKKQGERDISPHPIYFPLMRKIFDLALTGNYSVVALCKKAQELGILNNRGRPISKTQMYYNLTNIFYTGKGFVYAKKVYSNGSHKPMITETEYNLLQRLLKGRSKPRQFVHHIPLTGFIFCGECGMKITAEKHTKHYKNGTSQTFTYYRCSKKSKAKECSQPYIPEDELKKQVVEYLLQLKLSTKFLEWSIKWLNAENKGEQEGREAKRKAVKLAYDNIVKRLDSLLELKISPENVDGSLLSNDEFSKKKEALLKEKEILVKELNTIDEKIDKWIQFTSDAFDLAIRAAEKFNKSGPEDKKALLSAIGSNLTIKEGKLNIIMRTPFLVAKKIKEKIDNKEWLEPTDQPMNTNQMETLRQQSIIVGG